jgi:hypothetical protein
MKPTTPLLEALSALCRGVGGDAIVQILAAQAPTWLVQFPALLTPDRGDVLRREVLGATRERMLRVRYPCTEPSRAVACGQVTSARRWNRA